MRFKINDNVVIQSSSDEIYNKCELGSVSPVIGVTCTIRNIYARGLKDFDMTFYVIEFCSPDGIRRNWIAYEDDLKLTSNHFEL